MHSLTRPEAGFYGTHSAATEPGDHWSRLSALTGTPAELATAVGGLAVHREACGRHGFTLPEERREEAESRYLSNVLDVLLGLDDAPLTEAREPRARFAGVCRDFALLFTAALRHNGVPARLRCGYMTYGPEPGFHTDHWVAEYWRPGRGWTLADPEFAGYGDVGFDPMDVPRDAFIVAGAAWAAHRAGEADASTYGVRVADVDLSGPAMLRASVVRDLAALNKVEVLPWDVWGLAVAEPEPAPGELALVDRAAAVGAAGGPFEELRDLYENEERLRITGAVTSYTTYGGVRTVEVRTH